VSCKDRINVWKEYLESLLNAENKWSGELDPEEKNEKHARK